jgi:cobalt-precorrin 5A hydrolase
VLSFERPGPLHIICVSSEGAALALRIRGFFPEARIWGNRPFVPEVSPYEGQLREFVGRLWTESAGLIFVMASGIVVRSIAPYVNSKYSDPAVVVVDDAGRFSISLLSGHEGEANRLCLVVSEILAALPVVTTGTEAKRRIILGIGCRRGASSEVILDSIDASLAESGRSRDDVYALATIDLKGDEPGLLAAARELGVPLRVIPRSRVRALQEALRDETFAETVTGVAGVCIPSAILASPHSSLLLPKRARNGVTVAVAEDTCGVWASDRVDSNT